MTIQIDYRVDGKIIGSIDYRALLVQEGTKMTINLPSSYTPRALDTEILKFCSGKANVIMHGCALGAKEQEQLWTEYENRGFPLSKMSESLLVLELTGYIKHGIIPPSPSGVEITRLVDASNSCRTIKGIEQRDNKLRKRLRAITDGQNLAAHNIPGYFASSKSLMEAILTTTDEFQIASDINQLGFKVEFTDDKGPDFRLEGNTVMTLDAKSRMNRSYVGGSESDKSANFSSNALVALLCRDAYPAVTTAFNDQDASIALVNLSHSQYGPFMPMFYSLYDAKAELSEALKRAVELAESGKKAVVIYSRGAGKETAMNALTLERETVENYGRAVEKMEVIFKQEGKKLDFFDLANLTDTVTRIASGKIDDNSSDAAR